MFQYFPSIQLSLYYLLWGVSWGIRKVMLHVGFLPYCFEIPTLVSFPNPLSPALLCLAILWIFPLKFPLLTCVKGMITSHSWNPFFQFLWGVVQNIQASEFQALGLMPTFPCWWIFLRVLCTSKRTTNSSPTWAVSHIRMKRTQSPSCDPDQKLISESCPPWRPIFITCLLTSLERIPDSWQGCCLIPREKPNGLFF